MSLRLLRRLSDGLNRATENITVLLLGALVVVVFIGVIWRYLLRAPLAFIHETSILLSVWIAFLGMSVAFHNHGHIYLELLLDRLRGVPRKVLVSLVTWVTLAFFYIVVTRGVEVIQGTMAQSFQTIPVSLGWEYAALPVGALVSSLHLMTEWSEMLLAQPQTEGNGTAPGHIGGERA